MQGIVRMNAGDKLVLKKRHPCGSCRFEVLRVGSEVLVRCMGCGRNMIFDRIKLEKAVRRVETPSDE
jgi:hypothetical protein